MKENERTAYHDLVEILKELDFQSLLIMKSNGEVLLARQKMEEKGKEPPAA